jgi:quercetin dioxygenase-like cupin family protein
MTGPNPTTTPTPTAPVAGATPIVRAEDEGERRWFYGGGVHIWKATAEETGGAYLLFEDLLAGGKTTPLHTHPESDETMYVLDGEILVHIDGDEYRVGRGGLAMAPRGVPHAFLVVSETARLLCLHTPGRCQDFYFDASEPIADGRESTGPVDFDRIGASAARNGGIEILGPPPFGTTA